MRELAPPCDDLSTTGAGDRMKHRVLALALGLLEPDPACSEPAEMGVEPCLVAEAGDPSKEITRERGMG